MMVFLNPMILLFISLIVSFMQSTYIVMPVALLCAIIGAALSYVSEKEKYLKGILCFFYILSILSLDFLFYLPVIIYMYIHSSKADAKYILIILPFVIHLSSASLYILLLIAMEMIFAISLKIQFIRNRNIRQDYQKQRDATKELALTLSSKNQDLLIQQEQEIKIATLAERNRIAREIHDNVGHLLSSSLLQIGALQTLEKEDTQKESIENLRETISTAMDSVRNSVHDLHAESIELESMLQKVVLSFQFCKIDLEYDVIHPFKQAVVYHILAIIKEALNNVMKHSDATYIKLTVREQPDFYQVIILDNGSKKEIKEDGIGLRNIQDRVENLKGYVNISNSMGFRIFITLPKEEVICAF